MNDTDRHSWAEQYEEAAFALMLEEFSEAEGKRLMEEYEQALAAGEVPEVPQELDAKCRKLIDREFEKQYRNQKMQSFWKSAKRVAAVGLAVLSVSAGLVMSVDAIRAPIMNFFMEKHDKYTAINFDEDHVHDAELNKPSYDPLAEVLPSDYDLVAFTEDESSVYIRYENNLKDNVILEIWQIGGELVVDTEDATMTEITFMGTHAILVEENGHELYWKQNEKVYILSASSMIYDEFINIAEKIGEIS